LKQALALSNADRYNNRKLKELIIKGCYYSIEESVNDDFINTGF